MFYRLIFIFMSVLALSSQKDTKKHWEITNPDLARIFIDDPTTEESYYEGSGREVFGSLDDDDDDGSDDDHDDFEGSGYISGSGDFDFSEKNMTVSLTTISSTTTAKALTACQQLLSSSHYSDSIPSYVPECTPAGDFQRRQCKGGPGVGDCWCVDPNGREIPLTMKHPPHVPDCELGTNLKECVSMLLKHQHGLLGEFHPSCTFDGEFEKIQCHGMTCWCVDSMGKEIVDSKAVVPNTPVCDKTTTTIKTTTSEKMENERKKGDKDIEYEIPIPIPTSRYDDDVKIKLEPEVQEEELDNDETSNEKLQESTVHVMKQPGLLAAVIGGAVVGLLCAVLLVMFIVYRMRKKDEGSYPLDDTPKYPNYSYSKAQDKEFYA